MDGWTDGLAGLCHYGAYLHFYLICRLKIWEIERKRDEKGQVCTIIIVKIHIKCVISVNYNQDIINQLKFKENDLKLTKCFHKQRSDV